MVAMEFSIRAPKHGGAPPWGRLVDDHLDISQHEFDGTVADTSSRPSLHRVRDLIHRRPTRYVPSSWVVEGELSEFVISEIGCLTTEVEAASVVNEHRLVTGGDVEGVKVVDGEVVGVVGVVGRPVETLDRHDVAVRAQQTVALVEVLALLPFLI